MSRAYVDALAKVKDEYLAARWPLALVLRQWHTDSVARAADTVTRDDLERAISNRETTYYIRLCAVFEGIFKAHLRSNHPAVNVPRDPKVHWLRSTVRRREGLPPNQRLDARLEQVQRHRNHLAHGDPPAGDVPFDDAVAAFGKLVDRLSDPHR